MSCNPYGNLKAKLCYYPHFTGEERRGREDRSNLPQDILLTQGGPELYCAYSQPPGYGAALTKRVAPSPHFLLWPSWSATGSWHPQAPAPGWAWLPMDSGSSPSHGVVTAEPSLSIWLSGKLRSSWFLKLHQKEQDGSLRVHMRPGSTGWCPRWCHGFLTTRCHLHP